MYVTAAQTQPQRELLRCACSDQLTTANLAEPVCMLVSRNGLSFDP